MLNNIYYINIDYRTDRKEHVENELKKMDWSNYTRFNAIKNKDGRVGCSMSHLKILQDAKKNNLDYVVILEDDIEFTNPDLFNTMLSKFFKLNIEYDVLMLAGNIRRECHKLHDFIYFTKKCCTTTGYIVRKHYYDTLIDNIKTGILNLIEKPDFHYLYAIDTHWFTLQEKDTWLIFKPRTVTQKADYSDIEKQYINYNHLMLD